MKVEPRVVVLSLLACLLFGIVAQEVLMADGIGFNLAILSILFLLSVLFLRAKKVIDPSFPLVHLIAPVGVAVYGFAVPDSRGLDELNIFVLLLSMGYCALRCASGKALTLPESLAKVPGLLFAVPWVGLCLPFLADWGKTPKFKNMIVGRGVLIGLLAAIPFLAIFGTLLSQADPMFEKLLHLNINLDPDIVIPRMLIFGCSGIMVAGFLIYFSTAMLGRVNVVAGLKPDPSVPPVALNPAANPAAVGKATFAPVKPEKESEYVATFVTFFGLLAAMFLVFVLVQARYLFGGDNVVLTTAHLTYSDYARRGFMEIVSVASICLPLLVLSQYALKGFDEKVRKSVNVVVVIVVSLLFLLLASAVFRLKLYVGAYGLSPLRVYVAAGMVWLFLLFSAYLRHGLRWNLDRIGRFVFASMVMITMGLNLARPDYWIARVNLTRPEAKNLDPNMILGAGADAQSAIREFGSPTYRDVNTKLTMLEEYQRQLMRAPHRWKETSLSQIMALRK